MQRLNLHRESSNRTVYLIFTVEIAYSRTFIYHLYVTNGNKIVQDVSFKKLFSMKTFTYFNQIKSNSSFTSTPLIFRGKAPWLTEK